MNAPAFVVRTHSSDENHICLGTEPKTLCESTDIKSSVQLSREKLENFASKSDLCSKCQEMLDSVRDDVDIERTVECHRCNYSYSSYLSRSVENMNDGIVPICKPCYKDLLKNEDSGIEVEYEDAEPFFDSDVDRSFDINEILDN